MLLKNPRLSLSRMVLALGLGLAASGCGVPYIAQAARGQLSVMRARVPIARVIERPTTSDTLKSQLIRARRIRDFASRELGLPDNAAYRSYADIHRPYVVWNVVATPEFSVAPLQWCFPVAGCVAYRGYFSEQAANRFAAGLKARGDDVLVGGVAAYSTLGRFADPLLNTVAGYGELDLAGLIFHELAHQKVYLPGDSSFNEAYATAVEEAGVARYAMAQGDTAALTRWLERRRLRVEVTGQFIATRSALADLYASRVSDEEKRARKVKLLDDLVTQVRVVEKRAGRSSGYGAWIDMGLNNAYLASVATYYEQVPRFERLLHETCGDYMPCLHVQVARLAAGAKKKGPA
jgi:predicted aminopeptidase